MAHYGRTLLLKSCATRSDFFSLAQSVDWVMKYVFERPSSRFSLARLREHGDCGDW